MPGRDVSAATISMRPLQRAHSRTSLRKTRQINDAQGKRRRGTGAVGGSSIVGRSRAGPRDLRHARRDDGRAGRERGGEDAEVAREVGARARNERDEALDEFVRREHERGRAVAPGALELELEAAVVEAGESIGGDRRAREIARHALEARAIGRRRCAWRPGG